MARIFLTLVGIAYLALAGWCLLQPQRTARSVGFELITGPGQSEYLTVYGGLQIGLGLLFLAPWLKPDLTGPALLACLVIHTSLVCFRTLGFLLYSNLTSTTYTVAVIEWILFLLSALLVWTRGKNPLT